MSTSLENIIEAKRKILAKLEEENRAINYVCDQGALSIKYAFYYKNLTNDLPLGSAVITSSGNLEKNNNTKYIIHACPGNSAQSGCYKPNMKGIYASIVNTLLLAKKNKVDILYMPFIGSGIFMDSIFTIKFSVKEERWYALAYEILSAIHIADKEEGIKNMTIKICLFLKQKNIFDDLLTKTNIKNGFKDAFNGITVVTELVKGDDFIKNLDKKSDKIQCIVNAANTEGKFGDGISDAIKVASGNDNNLIKVIKDEFHANMALLNKYNLKIFNLTYLNTENECRDNLEQFEPSERPDNKPT